MMGSNKEKWRKFMAKMVKKKSVKAPKAEVVKKGAKLSEEETETEEGGKKKGRPRVKNKKGTVLAKDISPKGLKLIRKANELEEELITKKDELSLTLSEIKNEVGISYIDPDRKKAMSIMERGETFFLRGKPNGGVEARRKTLAKKARAAK